MCNDTTVRRYLTAPNAQVVRRRKTGLITQVNLSESAANEARVEKSERESLIRELIDATEGKDWTFDRRTASRDGMAFRQDLPCGGVVYALSGVTGS